MPPFMCAFHSRLRRVVARDGALAVCSIAAVHLAAVALMLLTEADSVGWALFLLAWGLLNCLWLALLRRPALSAVLALAIIALLVVLSRFKSDHLW
jgi:hypothetical protein